jgi:aminopeptidase N
VVADFTFGGMENSSATTLYEYAIVDERARLDVDWESLIAHELAHQWFGDLVTCRSFSEAWLNEGWATFLELIWKESTLESGRSEYDYALKGECDIYFEEALKRYSRPLVCKDYDAPLDVFDRHAYQKGAILLHAIRRLIGDNAFWAATHNYLTAHSFSIVESRDLQRAFELESGCSLDKLFDAHVYHAGHCAITFELSYVAESMEVRIDVRQTHSRDLKNHLCTGPLIAIFGFEDHTETHEFTLSQSTEVLSRVVPSKPLWVSIDPDMSLLAEVTVRGPVEWLANQLERAALDAEKWRAAAALGAVRHFRAAEALAKSLQNESLFWAVRAECASALGEHRSDFAKSALLDALKIVHPKVRRAACRALHVFREQDVADALATLATTDASYLVCAAASKSLGATRVPSAFETLANLLQSSSWAHSVAVGAVEGLGALEDPRAVPVLSGITKYGAPSRVRRAAMRALTAIDPTRATRKLLEDLLDDRDSFVRAVAAECLGEIGDDKAIGSLFARIACEDAPNVRRTLRTVIEALRTDAANKKLGSEVSKLAEENANLKARVQRLESKIHKET